MTCSVQLSLVLCFAEKLGKMQDDILREAGREQLPFLLARPRVGRVNAASAGATVLPGWVFFMGGERVEVFVEASAPEPVCDRPFGQRLNGVFDEASEGFGKTHLRVSG